MRITNEQVFILHVRPWRETSLLIEALSANFGRMGLLARGVQGPKRQVLRAALQPLQFVRVDAVQRGELAQLRSAEALDAAPLPGGEATLAAFYVNELVLRLAARGDPQPDLFDAYGRMRARLAMAGSLAWSLRRFERDLLDAIGFGMDFSSAACSAIAATATAAMRRPDVRCWHWPPTGKRPAPTTSPACAARCARCCCTTWVVAT